MPMGEAQAAFLPPGLPCCLWPRLPCLCLFSPCLVCACVVPARNKRPPLVCGVLPRTTLFAPSTCLRRLWPVPFVPLPCATRPPHLFGACLLRCLLLSAVIILQRLLRRGPRPAQWAQAELWQGQPIKMRQAAVLRTTKQDHSRNRSEGQRGQTRHEMCSQSDQSLLHESRARLEGVSRLRSGINRRKAAEWNRRGRRRPRRAGRRPSSQSPAPRAARRGLH